MIALVYALIALLAAGGATVGFADGATNIGWLLAFESAVTFLIAIGEGLT